jgi:hypothetical protein
MKLVMDWRPSVVSFNRMRSAMVVSVRKTASGTTTRVGLRPVQQQPVSSAAFAMIQTNRRIFCFDLGLLFAFKAKPF